MEWFQRLVDNPHIDMVLITDNQGRILQTSDPIGGQDELVASMIQAADVLAQSLTTELQRGPVQMLQITTDSGYLLIFPLALSTYHLALFVQMDAPLARIIAEIEKMIPDIDMSPFGTQDQEPSYHRSEQDEWNTQELIEAVREWLQNKSSGSL